MINWSDRVVYIVGGGTSLLDFDFNFLKDKFVVGVNDSGLRIPCNTLFSLDHNWVRNRLPAYKGLHCEKVFAVHKGFDREKFTDPTATYMERGRGDGFSPRKNIVYGCNSGFGALDLTQQRQATMIVLLGFDFYGIGKKNHWHREYTWGVPTPQSQYNSWLREFDTAAKQAQKKGITILNANVDSKIEAFKKVNVYEADEYFRSV